MLHTLASHGAGGQIAVAYGASNRVSGLRCRDLAPTCQIEVLGDLDGDGELEDETGVAIETISGSATLNAAQLERDPTAGWGAAYLRRAFTTDVVVAHDRNGDGDFADASEIADVNGNPELFTLVGARRNCFDLAFDAAGRLAVAYEDGGQRLLRDTNEDGDFSDPGEATLLGTASSACPEVADAGPGLAVAFDTMLWIDRNDDGDFADPDEQVVMADSIGSSGDLEGNGADHVIAAGVESLMVGDTAP